MSETFKSIRYVKPSKGGFQLYSSALPKSLNPKEVLIKVSYAPLNPVDLIIFNIMDYLNTRNNVRGVGREFAGTVVDAGEEINEEYKKGDVLIGLGKPGSLGVPEGPIAEYLVVTKENWVLSKVPENLEIDVAASVPLCYLTAISAIDPKKISEISKVLVIGGGTMVGMFTNQILKNIYGVHDLYSVQSSKTDELYSSKLNLKIDSINYDLDTRPLNIIAEEIITTRFNGEKFDVIIDTVGNSDFLESTTTDYLNSSKESHAKYYTAAGNSVLDYQGLKGLKSIFWPALRILKSKVWYPGFDYIIMVPSHKEEDLQLAVKFLSEGKITAPVDTVVSLDDFETAVKRVATHKAKGKVLIKL